VAGSKASFKVSFCIMRRSYPDTSLAFELATIVALALGEAR
jgi:hypothetical protein